jgi:hypothetical protein
METGLRVLSTGTFGKSQKGNRLEWIIVESGDGMAAYRLGPLERATVIPASSDGMKKWWA